VPFQPVDRPRCFHTDHIDLHQIHQAAPDWYRRDAWPKPAYSAKR
jgi:hypothetical protein